MQNWMTSGGDETAPAGVDVSRPTSARVYDALLGGKVTYAVDRAVAQGIISTAPEAPESARANRGFLHRAVRTVAHAGMHQFIDIGAGLPTQQNTHEVAQDVHPQAPGGVCRQRPDRPRPRPRAARQHRSDHGDHRRPAQP